MALSSIFHGSSSPRKFCQFEIRPESDFIVLHGNQRETPDFKFRGNIILMISEHISIRNIRITIEGRRKTSHDARNERDKIMSPQLPAVIVTKKTFLSITKTVTPEFPKTQTLGPSNYEFPFEFDLQGDVPESVEGMDDSYIVYSLKAVADRVMAKDLVAKRNLRVIRTLGRDRTEALRSADVSGTWPNKIKYQLTSVSRAVVFGTSVITEFELTPLLEKLRIGVTKVRLEEKRKVRTVPGPDRETEEGWQDMWTQKQIVQQAIMEVPEGSDTIDDELQIPMKKFKLTLPLPKSLRQCRQSVTTNEWIQIEHIMHYDIVLHNPDGHKSEIKAHHSIILYISPSLPIGENGETVDRINALSGASDLNGDMQLAPPLYETHQLDSLYEDINTTAFTTPGGGSTMASRDPSRNPSFDDLAALRTGGTEPLPENLRARLVNLQVNEGREGRSGSTDEVSQASPPGQQSAMDTGSPNQASYDMEALERMPSYGTAVRTPVRTPFNEAPPSYATATSRPPSAGA